MSKTTALAVILAVAACAASPASAQSWSFGVGVGVGAPVYYGPPPVYYETPAYGAPVIVGPVMRGGALSPDAIFGILDAAGYRELSPLALRGRYYRLNAVDPSGDLVALEISAVTGEIERARLLQARSTAAPPEIAPPKRRARTAVLPRPAPPAPVEAPPDAVTAEPSGPPPSTLRDRLEAEPEDEQPAGDGEDPEVVY